MFSWCLQYLHIQAPNRYWLVFRFLIFIGLLTLLLCLLLTENGTLLNLSQDVSFKQKQLLPFYRKCMTRKSVETIHLFLRWFATVWSSGQLWLWWRAIAIILMWSNIELSVPISPILMLIFRIWWFNFDNYYIILEKHICWRFCVLPKVENEIIDKRRIANTSTVLLPWVKGEIPIYNILCTGQWWQQKYI